MRVTSWVMTDSKSHIKMVSDIYEEFVKGNMERLYEHIDENITWTNHGCVKPFAGKYNGPEGVMRYLSYLDTVDLEIFNVESITENREDVFIMIRIRRIEKKTGKKTEGKALHIMKFDHDMIIEMDIYEPRY